MWRTRFVLSKKRAKPTQVLLKGEGLLKQLYAAHFVFQNVYPVEINTVTHLQKENISISLTRVLLNMIFLSGSIYRNANVQSV